MTAQFLRLVENTISTNKLLPSNEQPVIVGISGGADSVALLISLKELGYSCIAAHCNFNLRGNESLRDMQHTEALAKSLNVVFELKNFDVKEYCSQHKSVSIEMACRELRYAWFMELAEKYSAQGIAVGHNADDNIETFLFNMQRGTGINGLRGIQPKNDRGIIRPLINIHRKEIESFLEEMDIKFITDSSNLTNEYNRNKIRNQIIPTFERYFPNFIKGMDSTISNMATCDKFYQRCIEEKKRVYTDTSGNIKLKELIENEPDSQLLIYEWFRKQGLTYEQSSGIIKSAGQSGKIFNTSSSKFIIDHGNLIILNENNQPEIIFEEIFAIEHLPICEFDPTGNPDEAYFNTAVMCGTPLSVRTWEKGDRMIPFGMRMQKKVSDIFCDSKISITRKKEIPLLIKGDEILWIAGLRASALYPVSRDSDSFIRVRYIKQHKF